MKELLKLSLAMLGVTAIFYIGFSIADLLPTSAKSGGANLYKAVGLGSSFIIGLIIAYVKHKIEK